MRSQMVGSTGFPFGSGRRQYEIAWRRVAESYHSHVDILCAGKVVLVKNEVFGSGAIEPTWALTLDQYAYAI